MKIGPIDLEIFGLQGIIEKNKRNKLSHAQHTACWIIFHSVIGWNTGIHFGYRVSFSTQP